MASLLTMSCSNLAFSSSSLLSANLSFLSTSHREVILLTPFASNTDGRKCANSSINLVASHSQNAHNPSQENHGSRGLQNWGMTKLLAGLACGVVSGSAGAWDPAFADVPPTAVTPYSQAADQMRAGLVKGRIQPCPLDINPNCVSTSSNNGGYAAPWIIPESSTSKATKKIETAILSTQKNPAILQVQETPEGGTYLVAEADGFLGRDMMEFLIKDDVVTYRSMAKKVIYLYPFTTPIGDFDGQHRRLKTLEDELGWSVPSFENTYDQETEQAN